MAGNTRSTSTLEKEKQSTPTLEAAMRPTHTLAKESAPTPKQYSTPAGRKGAVNNSTPAAYKPAQGVTLIDFEERLAKLTDDIVSRISTEMNLLRNDVIYRISLIEDRLATHAKDVETSLEKLQSRQEEAELKIKEVEKSLKSLQEQGEDMKMHLAESQTLEGEVADLQKRCDVLERREIAADAIIFGIPQLPNENLKTIFHHLCHSIDCMPPTLKAVFRSQRQRRNNGPPITDKTDTPIIVKFSSPHERNTVLQAVALFCKNERQLCLQDVGIKADNNKNIHMYGSMTSKNRSLYHRAVRLKRNKQLFSVFTHLGSVYVKESAHAKGILVENDRIMNAIAASCQTRETIEAAEEEQQQ